MREIRVRAIHNRTRTREVVGVPRADGTVLEVPPGETVRGSWLVRFDETEHPELSRIAEDNEMWFHDSPNTFDWGSVTFWDAGL